MLAIDRKAQIAGSTEVNSGVIEIPLGPINGFDAALWQLLQDIKTAGIPLRGKIAEYAGFYNKIGAAITTEWDPTSDNGVNPDQPQTGASQPNKSLDKLTFLIMFRLPFYGEVVEVMPRITDPEADLYNNRKIVKKADGTYVIGAFHESLDSKGKVTGVAFQLCTVTRSNQIANFDIDGKDLFYDAPTDSFYVFGPYVSNFGDPLAVAGTSWSKRANNLRGATGLKLLNGAGEQVSLVGGVYKHVDDAGKLVNFDYNTPDTPNAYAYYEINFGDINPAAAESITDQATIDAIKTLPLYYFLTVYTENKPQAFHREAHYPDQIETSVNAKRPITFGTYSNAGVFSASSPQPASAGIDLQIIQRDTASRYYVATAGTGAINYLTEDFSGDEDFTADSFYPTGNLLTGLKVRYETGQFYAENSNKISRATTRFSSGLTLGYGYDIGLNFAKAYVYKVVFKIQKKNGATGSFTLNYESGSAAIPFATTTANLRQALSELIAIDPDLIAVAVATTGLTAGYSGWDVSIQQKIGDDVDGFYNIYSHELFYHKPAVETPAKVLITPATDSQRYVERSASELPPYNYSDFETLLNGFYASGDFTAPDSVQDGAHKAGFNGNLFKSALKRIFGLYNGAGMLIYLRNKGQFEAFQLPVAKQTLVKNYQLIFSQKYYTQKIVTDNIGSIVATGATPNVLEKLLLATVSYGGIGRWQINEYQMNQTTFQPERTTRGNYKRAKRADPGIILAISSHNQYELSNVFRNRNPRLKPRRDFLVGYVQKFQHILYRGVEA